MSDVNLNSLEGKKTAFVCSGGVVLAAAWHTGVAMALDEIGFHFASNENPKSGKLNISTYVGSSAGALITIYLASGFTPHDLVRSSLDNNYEKLKSITYRDMLKIKRNVIARNQGSLKYDRSFLFNMLPLVQKTLLKPFTGISGFFSTSGLHDYLVKNVLKNNSFEDFDVDLFTVATQLDHSRKVIFGKYNYPSPKHDYTAKYYTGISVANAAAASMAVPPFYSPHPIDNPITGNTDYYIDGEIRETLSTHVAIDNKCDTIICSWTHTPYHFKKEIGSLVNYGLPAICIQAIYLMIQKKIITSRNRISTHKDLIATVNQYFKEEKISDVHRKKVLNIIESKLDINPNLKIIDIYPDHDNHKIFFTKMFSLNKDQMSRIVKMGYKKTMAVFKDLS